MQSLIYRIKRITIITKFILLVIGWLSKFYMFVTNKVIGVNKKKVVFISFGGKSYSDNPRSISQKLHEMHPNYEIIWLFNRPEEKNEIVPDYVRCVQTGSYRALKELATAKFWVDNFCKPSYIYKSKKQLYIQTWHGDRGFKKVLYDSTFVKENYKLIESEILDLAVSGSKYGDSTYRTAFRYSGEILKKGCPRNDLLVENSYIKKSKIKHNLNIDSSTNILMYAPTLRRDAAKENKLQSSKDIDLLETLEILEKTTNKKWVCIVRAHSAVKGLDAIPYEKKQIIDGTSYEDMSELLLISDFLITDYSSSAGDFAVLNRPMILFQPDRKEYIKKDRTFYFDLDNSPYMIAKNKKELIDMIDSLDWNTISQNCKSILDFYGTLETGDASKRVVEYIVNKSN
ncbi:CDP-glycerol glycerophosphotransferase family protein [Peribacillus frigoritolerans]|uniref:CDP-glycerol glycerophosphotransferase family protein n=1 Tax=Peribacillus frigoritolerans TaxID=450367 RepID=UPI003F80289B